MNSVPQEGLAFHDRRYEDLIYIRQVLGELRGIAAKHQEKMICYLIDMAYHETMDTLQAESNPLAGQR